MTDLERIRISLLCFEAKRWIGAKEEAQNSGQIIRMFQSAVDQHASNEPWCMAFAQFCIMTADKALRELFAHVDLPSSSIFRSEHCLTTWNKSPHLQIQSPLRGSLCIWQQFSGHKPTSSGHTGIL